jgi:hypothetical protein
MTTLPKICLAVSSAEFVAGSIIDFGEFSVIPEAAAVLPLGAVFFGLFLISFMLEKEMVKFDAEEAERFELARRKESSSAKCKNCQNRECQSVSKSATATFA